MDKISFRTIGATTYLSPIPAVMLGCAENKDAVPNLITVAWTGIVCTKPAMVSVSIRKERYSHDLIQNSGEFTLNLTNEDIVKAVDFCGVKSGRDVHKFAHLGLTPIAAPGLDIAPGIAEAPAFLSCKLHSVTELGSHDLFLAQIKEVSIQDKYFLEDGSIDESAMKLVGYIHGKYYSIGKPIGFFGYSVAGDEALKRRGIR